MSDIARTINLEHLTASQLKTILGEYNNHIKYIQQRLEVVIVQRKHNFSISGTITAVERVEKILMQLADDAMSKDIITPEDLHLIIQSSLARDNSSFDGNLDSELDGNLDSNDAEKNNIPNINNIDTSNTMEKTFNKNAQTEHNNKKNNHKQQNSSPYNPVILKTKRGSITPRSRIQNRYVKLIMESDISFGVGPAGTGKTYLAVACAVDMLERNEIERILLVRPAVEAGEKLGFLPGDLTQKIDPYLRPLYDALYEMLGNEKVTKLMERQIIEVAPLAYMRGRTLNNSFVILDEAQNTTPEQMKMFLTRLGFGSRAVITGDITQVDLPRGHKSGLTQALSILSKLDEIHITKFDSRDVVRHHLVQKIVEAYNLHDEQTAQEKTKRKV